MLGSRRVYNLVGSDEFGQHSAPRSLLPAWSRCLCSSILPHQQIRSGRIHAFREDIHNDDHGLCIFRRQSSYQRGSGVLPCVQGRSHRSGCDAAGAVSRSCIIFRCFPASELCHHISRCSYCDCLREHHPDHIGFRGIIFLKEPFSAMQMAGIVLILLGVWKVSSAEK